MVDAKLNSIPFMSVLQIQQSPFWHE